MNADRVKMLVQLLSAEVASPVEDTAYVNPVNPTKPSESPWNLYGFSRYADDEGRVRVQPWEEYRLSLPDTNKAKKIEYVYARAALEHSIFPSEIARLKCEQNLSQRLWAIVMSPPMFSYEGIRYQVTERPVPDGIDWNQKPGSGIGYKWKSDGLFDDTLSGNWNPNLYDADWWFKFLVARAEAEAQNTGGGWHKG